MKKKVIILTLAAASLFSATSCNEWLDEKPKAIAASTFYNTESEAEAAIDAVVNGMRGIRDMTYGGMMECYCDYSFGRASWAPNSTYQTLDAKNFTRTDSQWSSLYSMIRNANIVIEKIPGASALTDAQKSQYVAEAKFFRAFAYFDLVKFWDHAPYRSVEDGTLSGDCPCSPKATLYEKVIKDLDDAIADLPTSPKLLGRPFVDAAKILKAEVLLTQKASGYYPAAAALLQPIVDSGKYSLVKVSSSRDFDKLFGSQLGTSEEIFYIKSCRTPVKGWNMLCMYAYPSFHVPGTTDGSKMLGGSGWYAIDSSTDLLWYQEWLKNDAGDLRRDLCVGVLPNSLNPDGTVNPSAGVDKDAATGVSMNTFTIKFHDEASTGSDGVVDVPIYRYAEILLMYAECLFETGNIDKAMECINQIRRRAYGLDPTTASAVDYAATSDRDTFYEILIKEEGYEMYGENKRWPFLVRLGKDVCQKYITKYKNRTISDTFWLWRIPESEMLTNLAVTAADQNPGY